VSASSSGASPARFQPFALLLSLAYAAWIWWLSSRTFDTGSGAIYGFAGNSFHFVLFGGLTVLVCETLRVDGGLTRARLFAVLALVSAYGIVDEWHQSFTPGRSSDPADVCVDVLAAVGWLSLWWGVRGRGHFPVGAVRFVAVGAAVVGFNAWRTWGPWPRP